MKTKHKTPAGYAAPLKSRAAIIAWLTDRALTDRGRHHGLFTFDVKLHHLKTDFTYLCGLARKNGDLPANASPRYMAAVEAVYDESRDAIWEAATEDACRQVTEDDTNRMLWDGSGTVAEWEFAGRSGGWLVLTEFDGVKFAEAIRASCMNQTDWAAEFFAETGYKYLRNLYRFLLQCAHDFRRPESDVEYSAAFNLFANFAHEVETDEQEAARIVTENAEATERAHWEARDTVTA